MAVEELADDVGEPEPAWLAKDDEALPEALQAFYARGLPVGVQILCERGRKMMRDGYVHGLRVVHKALAQEGLFKEWCAAAGLNYSTAKSTVARKQAAGTQKRTRSPAKKLQLVLRFEDEEQRAATVSGLRIVLDATPEAGEDNWAFAVLVLLGVWEEHQAQATPPPPPPPEGEAA
jgi:hypothetical protein